MSMMSMFGVIGLSGVVVNDSLVMIDFINDRLRRGMPGREAIIDGAKARFRPIFLTSVTTFLGVAPLVFERSLQAQILIPMAASLGFGILFATVVLMLIVPALTMVQHRITERGSIAPPSRGDGEYATLAEDTRPPEGAGRAPPAWQSVDEPGRAPRGAKP